MTDDKTSGSDAGAKTVRAPGRRKGGAQMVRLDPAKSWTAEAQERFIDTLAATSSVTMAAEAAGFTTSTCNYHRRKDPVFADEWDAAKAAGVERVELLLVRGAEEALARMFGGGRRAGAQAEASEESVGPNAARASGGATETPFPPFSFDQAIAVVRLFRGRDTRERETAGRSRRHWRWTPMDPEKAREIILKNVEAVRRARNGGPAPE